MSIDVHLRYEWGKFRSRLHRWRVAAASNGIGSAVDKAVRTSRTSRNGAQPDGDSLARLPMAGSILFVDSGVPRANRDSGSLRAFNLMKLMAGDGYDVHFLAEDGADGAQATALRSAGVQVHRVPSTRSIPSWFAENCVDCAAVVVARHHLASYWIAMARHLSPRALIVFDTVDLHHLREQREAELTGNRALARASGATRARELSAIRRSDVTWVVSPTEKALIENLAPAARVLVLPNLHECEQATPGPEDRHGLLFVGGGRHPPNIDAARWLVTEIFPIVRRRLPECTLELVGEDLESQVGTGHGEAGVRFHGHVPDLGGLVSHCRVGLAPLRFGAGVKGKVNHYMAHGLPTVATQCASEGMHLEHGTDVLIADGAEAFADAVVVLHKDQSLWRGLAAAGKENVRRHFSFESARAPVNDTFGPAPGHRQAR